MQISFKFGRIIHSFIFGFLLFSSMFFPFCSNLSLSSSLMLVLESFLFFISEISKCDESNELLLLFFFPFSSDKTLKLKLLFFDFSSNEFKNPLEFSFFSSFIWKSKSNNS